MAKQRVVNTRFWDDGYIVSLGPLEKLVFLYVLTNPLTDLCGAYEISLRRISADTGIRPAKLTEIMATFEAAGKILYRDGWIVIRNFAKHQAMNPKVTKGIERSLSSCPQWIKDSLSKPIKAYRTLTLTSGENLDLKGLPEPEPEPGNFSNPQNREEIANQWLDAIAQAMGAKSRFALTRRADWWAVIQLAVADGFQIRELAAEITATLHEPKFEMKFFKPEKVLDTMRLKRMAPKSSRPNRPTARELLAQVELEEQQARANA